MKKQFEGEENTQLCQMLTVVQGTESHTVQSLCNRNQQGLRGHSVHPRLLHSLHESHKPPSKLHVSNHPLEVAWQG